MIGQTVAHYTITAKLGAGGMGEVYLADDAKLGRQVALKFLPDSLTQDPEARERLVREARAASQLSHPNIVAVHMIDEHDGRDFIVMEYVDGSPANEHCREYACDLGSILGVVIGIGNGLDRAHKAGIVHRDLKPSNVLVQPDGRARILDFGLAKSEGTEKLTKTGSTIGTVAYMSPEQGRGEEADHRSDIFSLGVILYELVAGQQPFGGTHEAAIMYAIANEIPDPLARYKQGVPDDLQRIVTKCLAKRPQDRYQSAADLVTDLKQMKRVFADPSKSIHTGSAIIQRPRRPLWQGVAAMALVAVLGVALFWLIRGEGNDANSDSEHGAKTLVVLPFENLGSSDDEYFADGITDEITSKLAQIQGLHVISRTSAMQYKGTEKNLKQIGEELGVAYVLEGTIRWDKSGDTSRVRITPQLIKVGSDFHVWANNYERAITQIFSVQADIATQIATALNITLDTGNEPSRPTNNPDAYAYYLRGMETIDHEWDDIETRDVLTAIELFEKATTLDSEFAEPHAAIGLALAGPLWVLSLSVDSLRLKSQNAIAQALKLGPNLPLAHSAKGFFHLWIEQDYDLALSEFTQAKELGADKGEVLWQIAQVQMRQGKWEEAERNLLDAVDHNPRSVPILQDLGALYSLINRYDEAARAFERALDLAPDNGPIYGKLGHVFIEGRGDTATAGKWMRDGITRLNSAHPIAPYEGALVLNLYRYRLAEVTPDLVRASFLEDLSRTDLQNEVYGLARVFDLRGNRDSALIYYDSLIVLLEENLQSGFEDFHDMQNLGLVCLLAGRSDDAIRYARRGMEVMPISSCHW